MIRLILATSNVHKVRELREMFKALPHFDLLSLRDFKGCLPLPSAQGSCLEMNARIKAEHVVQQTGCLTLADDSGLFVPALGGAPGVASSCYAGMGATDKENCQKLLLEMQGMQEEHRYAYYECCLILAYPDGSSRVSRSCCLGSVAEQPQGSQGFGYDALFIKEGYHQTFAELGEATKNRISHRRKAMDQLLPTLEMMQR